MRTPKLLGQLHFLLLLMQGCHGDYEGSESSLCVTVFCVTLSVLHVSHTHTLCRDSIYHLAHELLVKCALNGRACAFY